MATATILSTYFVPAAVTEGLVFIKLFLSPSRSYVCGPFFPAFAKTA